MESDAKFGLLVIKNIGNSHNGRMANPQILSFTIVYNADVHYVTLNMIDPSNKEAVACQR